MKFNKAWIRTNHTNTWVKDHDIVEASYFRQYGIAGKDCEKKVVIGRLLAISSPDGKGNHYGYQMTMKSQAVNNLLAPSGKKQKVGSGTYSKYAYMLVFADQINLPSCFTIILQTKMEFQKLFAYPALSHDITIGDLLAVVKPRAADAVLGDNMTIMKDPYLLCALEESAAKWPQHDLIMSDQAQQQVSFFKYEQKIEISMIRLLWKDNVPCSNVTCDRQNIRCRGCFGTRRTLEPIVLQSDIDILNALRYDPGGHAVFPEFRSFKFTSLFFENISSLSARAMDDKRSMDNLCETNINAMVEYINENKGWSVAGWHRRGVIATGSGDNEEYTLSYGTRGHLTFLQPTDMSVLEKKEFKKHLIPTEMVQEPVALTVATAATTTARSKT